MVPRQYKEAKTKMSSKIVDVLKHCKQTRFGRTVGVLDQHNRFGKNEKCEYQTQADKWTTNTQDSSSSSFSSSSMVTTVPSFSSDSSFNSSVPWNSPIFDNHNIKK